MHAKRIVGKEQVEVGPAKGASQGVKQHPIVHHRRESNRRASDAMMMEEARRRLSNMEHNSDKRASIYGIEFPNPAELALLDTDEE